MQQNLYADNPGMEVEKRSLWMLYSTESWLQGHFYVITRTIKTAQIAEFSHPSPSLIAFLSSFSKPMINYDSAFLHVNICATKNSGRRITQASRRKLRRNFATWSLCFGICKFLKIRRMSRSARPTLQAYSGVFSELKSLFLYNLTWVII